MGEGLIATDRDSGLLPSFQSALKALVAVKAAPGRLYGWYIQNPNATDAFVQAFDASATGNVTLGTTAPKYVLWVPGSGGVDDFFPLGVEHDVGLVFAATTTATGSTAVTTGLVASLFYR